MLLSSLLSKVTQRRTYSLDKIVNFSHAVSKMTESVQCQKGLPLKEVVTAINSYADQKLAASWDNVGLLIEPTKPKLIKHILLTNDLTEDVMEEAIHLNTDLIISYHPPIFAPLKSITTRTWKERIAASCLENKIALYSPHTSFDSVKGGVNDWLAEAFDIETSAPIIPGDDPENGYGRLCTLKSKVSLPEAVDLVKKRTGLPHVRVATTRKEDNMINSIAVCAGAGTSILKGISADLYITGEMLHHDVLDAVHIGANVILTNHSDSERGFLKVFASKFYELLGKSVQVDVSRVDTDPLKTV